MAEKEGEWQIRRILKTKVDLVNGKSVKKALVDWEPSWVPVDDLSAEDMDLFEDRYVTVLGPLDVQNDEQNTNTDSDYDRECREWLCRKGPEKGGVLFVDTYVKLRTKFPEALLDYFEKRIQYRVTKSGIAITLDERGKASKTPIEEKENKNGHSLSVDVNQCTTPIRKGGCVFYMKPGPYPNITTRRRPLSEASAFSENV